MDTPRLTSHNVVKANALLGEDSASWLPSLAGQKYLPVTLQGLGTSVTPSGALPQWHGPGENGAPVAQRRSRAPPLSIRGLKRPTAAQLAVTDDYTREIGPLYERWTIDAAHSARVAHQVSQDKRLMQQEALEPLERVPPVFFNREFSLESLLDIKDIDLGLGSDSSLDAETSSALQDHLTNYISVIEAHLVKEVGERSASFFAALANLEDLSAKTEACSSHVAALESAVHGSSPAAFQVHRGLQLLDLRKKKMSLESLDAALASLSDISSLTEHARFCIEHSDWLAALETANAVDSCRSSSSFDISRVKALNHIPDALERIRKESLVGLESDLKRVLLHDLKDAWDSQLHDNHVSPTDPASIKSPLASQAKAQVSQAVSLVPESVVSASSLFGDPFFQSWSDAVLDFIKDVSKASFSSLDPPDLFRLGLFFMAYVAFQYDLVAVKDDPTSDLDTARSHFLHPLAVSLTSLTGETLSQQFKFPLSVSPDPSPSESDTQAVHQALENFISLANETSSFCEAIDSLVGRRTLELRNVLNAKSATFVFQFHQYALQYMALLVEKEKWSQIPVPPTLQHSVNLLIAAASESLPENPLGFPKDAPQKPSEPEQKLAVESQSYYLVPAVAVATDLILDYVLLAASQPSLTPTLASRAAEFAKTFNSRACQVVLGAGAIRTAGLKNISARHLAMASQAVALLAHLTPFAREALRRQLPPRQAIMLTDFDRVKRDLADHQREIHQKFVTIMNDRIAVHIKAVPTALSSPSTEPHPFIVALSKESLTLSKVLDRLLPRSSFEDIIYRVLVSFADEFSPLLEPHVFVSDDAKTSIIRDLDAFRDNFSPFPSLNLAPIASVRDLAQSRPIQEPDHPDPEQAQEAPQASDNTESSKSVPSVSLFQAPDEQGTPSSPPPAAPESESQALSATAPESESQALSPAAPESESQALSPAAPESESQAISPTAPESELEPAVVPSEQPLSKVDEPNLEASSLEEPAMAFPKSVPGFESESKHIPESPSENAPSSVPEHELLSESRIDTGPNSASNLVQSEPKAEPVAESDSPDVPLSVSANLTPETHPEPAQESEPVDVPLSVPATDPTPEAKAESMPESQPVDVPSVTEAESTPENKPEPISESEPAGAPSVPDVDRAPENKPELVSESEPVGVPSVPDVDRAPETKAELTPEPGYEAESTPEPESETQPAPEPESTSVPDVESERQADSAPNPDPTPEYEPGVSEPTEISGDGSATIPKEESGPDSSLQPSSEPEAEASSKSFDESASQAPDATLISFEAPESVSEPIADFAHEKSEETVVAPQSEAKSDSSHQEEAQTEEAQAEEPQMVDIDLGHDSKTTSDSKNDGWGEIDDFTPVPASTQRFPDSKPAADVHASAENSERPEPVKQEPSQDTSAPPKNTSSTFSLPKGASSWIPKINTENLATSLGISHVDESEPKNNGKTTRSNFSDFWGRSKNLEGFMKTSMDSLKQLQVPQSMDQILGVGGKSPGSEMSPSRSKDSDKSADSPGKSAPGKAPMSYSSKWEEFTRRTKERSGSSSLLSRSLSGSSTGSNSNTPKRTSSDALSPDSSATTEKLRGLFRSREPSASSNASSNSLVDLSDSGDVSTHSNSSHDLLGLDMTPQPGTATVSQSPVASNASVSSQNRDSADVSWGDLDGL